MKNLINNKFMFVSFDVSPEIKQPESLSELPY